MKIGNEIFLRRKNKIYIGGAKSERLDSGVNKLPYIATILKNLQSVGYTFSNKLIDKINKLTLDQIIIIGQDIINNVKKMLGAHAEYNPMYPNFPQQVMDVDEAELYVNAVMHYLGDAIGVRILPDYEKEERDVFKEKTKVTIIDLGSGEEFKKIFVNLFETKTSLSPQDKLDISEFIKHNIDDIEYLLPSKFNHKETMIFIFIEMIKNKVSKLDNIISKHIKTVTDVLRFIVGLSNGDISLAEKTKFRNFSRKERRLILNIIEIICNKNILPMVVEEMASYKKEWIRIGERLHPGEYMMKYPLTYKAFNEIRNNKIYTYNGSVEKFIHNGNIIDAVNLLKIKPGEFARRLDKLLRMSSVKERQQIINNFKSVIEKISSPILIQLISHFFGRNDKEYRTFIPKGNTAKIYGIENHLLSIPKKDCIYIIDYCQNELKKRFADKEKLGNIYLDKNLKNYVVPFSQRSASKSLKTIERGSSFSLEKDSILRFFLWWKDIESQRVDIDLSCAFYTEDWTHADKDLISYENLKIEELNSCHSGDITSAPNGACEFIDLDIKTILKKGKRYAIITFHAYTNQKYSELDECFGGWMERKKSQSGEIFEPKTVKNKFDISTDSRICVSVIIDFEKRKIIWTDMSSRTGNFINNIKTTNNQLVWIAKSMTNLNKMSLYDLFELHADVRGSIVENKEDADIIFSEDEGITPFDTDVIISEYL